MSPEIVSVIVWIIIGLVAGLLANLVVGGATGLIGYLVAGLLGSLVGGFLARAFKIRLNVGSPIAEQIIISFVGAIVVLLIVRIIN